MLKINLLFNLVEINRLLTFPNVLITGHQGFFTEEALRNIAETTLGNITAFDSGRGGFHEVTLDMAKAG